MTDRTVPDDNQTDLAGLAMQPTGSGVADFEIAYEQMKLAKPTDLEDAAAVGSEAAPTAAGLDAVESEAHPS